MSTDNICLCKVVERKYTCCNPKTTELLNCALIGVCAVIRSNTVYIFHQIGLKYCGKIDYEVMQCILF